MPEIVNQKEYNTEQMKHLEPLGLLAGGIAHDFNNLLTAILGNASLAHKHKQSPEHLDIYLSRIQEASQSAAVLCKQMLAYAGKGDFSSHEINMSEAVEDMSRLLEVSLMKGVTIHYNLNFDIPKVQIDLGHLQQMLINLIINANEAMEGSGQITVSTGVMKVDENTASVLDGDRPKAGEYVFVEVMDEGCGMSSKTQAKIFQPFYTTKPTGHGLGMSTILATVDGQHGIMQLDSELGQGSRLRIALPKTKNKKQDVVMPEEYDALQRFQLGGKVLLVDDEEIVLETMQVMLEDLGCDTILAQDGQEALDIYQQNQADIALILLDLTMPKMDGKTCVSELMKLNPKVKIILSSGYTEEDVLQQFKGVGLSGFLAKPCSLKQLSQALKKAI
ncbi:MAG: response regulator [Ghiorsea sp.]